MIKVDNVVVTDSTEIHIDAATVVEKVFRELLRGRKAANWTVESAPVEGSLRFNLSADNFKLTSPEQTACRAIFGPRATLVLMTSLEYRFELPHNHPYIGWDKVHMGNVIGDGWEECATEITLMGEDRLKRFIELLGLGRTHGDYGNIISINNLQCVGLDINRVMSGAQCGFDIRDLMLNQLESVTTAPVYISYRKLAEVIVRRVKLIKGTTYRNKI